MTSHENKKVLLAKDVGLDMEMNTNSAEAETLKDYIKAILIQLSMEGSYFDPVYPFGGDASWHEEVKAAYIKNGADPSRADEWTLEWFLGAVDSL